jgi:hypothetical protein
MIVQLRTRAQAAKVAELTGGTQLAGKPNPDGSTRLSRCVDVGSDFEELRAGVESVSVLFDLYAVTLKGLSRLVNWAPAANGLDGHCSEVRGRVAY